MVVQPVSPQVVVDLLVDLAASLEPGRRWRIVIDGAPPTRPGALADALVGPLRAAGRPVVRISAGDFLRPASLRWEHGREDPDAFYDDWLDLDALTREVLTPFGPGGTGRYLPSLRDPVRDRSTRAARLQAPAGAVLVLDGSLLLGRGLDLDRTAHLAVRPATLARRTLAHERWTLPAFARYAAEVDPERGADVVIRVDDPRHPALLRGGTADRA
ncbi:uridine kinase [Pengzhenrongella frigida]|uniref:Uridine kinase n=1 Tax=Pengzhenrongella frigida TaxID=1259133 RepID=A0A4Q5MV44_9MICO|nr:uridine kinase [Cellulomonas sp. HLT2-17]RYV49355.1 uridine kinase [Cellulomonas sp. HLT2-17]